MAEREGSSSSTSATTSWYVTRDGRIRVAALLGTLVSGLILTIAEGWAAITSRFFDGLAAATETNAALFVDLLLLPFDVNTELWALAWEEAATSLEGFGLFAFPIGVVIIASFVWSAEALYTALTGRS